MSRKGPADRKPAGSAVRLVHKVRTEVKRTARNLDAGQVHDLRVGIRRARQCLDVFHEALPSRTVRKARKKLGALLDDAAPVRDIDVVRELMKSLHVRPSAALSRELSKERARLQRKLKKSLLKFKDRDPAQSWMSDLEDEKDVDRAPGFEALPTLAGEYFLEGDRVSKPSTPVKELHRFRLKTKKFRYTLELYEGSLGSQLKARLDSLRTIQDHLGAISDCLRTLEVLDGLRDADEASVDHAMKAIRPEIDKQATAFRRKWKQGFDAKERNEWMRFLSGQDSATTPRRPAGKAVHISSGTSKTA